MKPQCLSLSIVVALALSASAPDARAAVMVSNLAEPTFSSFPVGFWWMGSQFLTDASASATPGNFFVAIYSNASGKPGVLLEMLAGSSNPAAAGNYSYTSTGLSLTSNTSYWVVAGVSSGGAAGSGYNWTLAGDPFHFTGPWTIPATDTHITSYDQGGANWNDLPNDAYPRQFSVSATAVPEPSALGLAGAGSIAAWLLRLRRRA